MGGVIGTVLEIHGDRYTLLTGALGEDGNLDGPQPTRIVFVRQAIARKIEPIEDVQVRVDDEPVENSTNGKRTTSDGRATSTTSAATARTVSIARRLKRGEPQVGGRAQKRQRRNLLISVLVVVAISLGSFAAVFAAKWTPRLGLDLAGGVSVVYTAEGQHISQSDLDETVNILNLRVDGLGVSGAQVQATGKNQISVSIPGVTNAQQVLNQIGQTARMFFRPVLCYAAPEAVPKSDHGKPLPPGIENIPACSSSSQLTESALGVTPDSASPNGFNANNVPPDPQYAVYPSTSGGEAELREQHGVCCRRCPGRPTVSPRGIAASSARAK